MRGRDSQILGLGCRLKLGLVGSRQGADICRWGQVQVARECKVTVVVHISDQEAEEYVVAQGWVCSAGMGKRPAPRSQEGGGSRESLADIRVHCRQSSASYLQPHVGSLRVAPSTPRGAKEECYGGGSG